MDKINQCFKKIIKYSSLYREKNNEFDGLLYWTFIKQQINKINVPFLWNTDNIEEVYKQISKLDKFDDKMDDAQFVATLGIPENDPNDPDKLIEVNHFYIQLLRIPLYKENTFQRLMQVALNIGQLLGSTRNLETFNNKELSKIFVTNNMNDIKTYSIYKYKNDELLDDVIVYLDALNKYIESNDYQIDKHFDSNGGNKYFKYKYIKYRTKYETLKY